MYTTPPTHFQWREALFPTSSPSVVGRMYEPGEAGMRGVAYNTVMRLLRGFSWALNLVLFLPMMAVTLISSIVTLILSLPLQALGLVILWVSGSPPETVEKFMNRTRVLRFPGVILIHLTTLPVKLVNLLIAVVAYFFGPKTWPVSEPL